MNRNSGFTLIQISIALMIIGLIVGGILVGQNLIQAAYISAQVSQITKYNTTVVQFQGKYQYLPGDIPNPGAAQYGFQARGAFAGEGDGNGLIEGNCYNSAGNNNGWFQGCGELAVFWQDLSTAGLLDTTIYGYDTKGANYPYMIGSGLVDPNTLPYITGWLPAAKIGNTNYVYIMSMNGINYFTISTVTQIGWSILSTSNPGLTVQQAYNIDNKIDDGLPQSGSVTACYINHSVVHEASIYAAGNMLQGANGGSSTVYANNCIPTTAATPYATTNCYDNNNVAGTQTYSISKNATQPNCALSFEFQTQ